MNKFFRLVSMFAIAGVTFAYTSCTDYSEDINKVDNRVDNVEGRLTTVEGQVKNLETTTTQLKDAQAKTAAAVTTLETTLKELQTKHDKDIKDLQKAYADADAALKTEIQGKIDALEKAHNDEVKKINAAIKALQDDVTALQEKAAAVEALLPTLATKKELEEASKKTADAIAEVNKTIGALQGDLEIAQKNITALQGKVTTLEEDVAGLKTAVENAQKAADDAQTAADKAQDTADKALGEIDALKKALGAYAKEGALESKIAALEKMDSTLQADKFDTEKFGTYFAKELKDVIGAYAEKGALEAKLDALDGKDEDLQDQINKLDAKVEQYNTALNERITELDEKVEQYNTELNARIDAVLGIIAGRLSSIAFIPQYYVDGVPAILFETIAYDPMDGDKAGEDKAPVYHACSTSVGNHQVRNTSYYANLYSSFTSAAATAKYRLNPRSIDFASYVGGFSFVGEKADYVHTRAVAPAAPVSIYGTPTCDPETGYASFTVVKNEKINTDTNYDKNLDVIALKAVLPETVLTDKEIAEKAPVEVYSEYVHVNEVAITASDVRIADDAKLQNKDIATGYAYAGGEATLDNKHEYKIKVSDAQAQAPVYKMPYNKPFDLSKLVNTCVNVEVDDHCDFTSIDHKVLDLNKYGLHYRYSVAKTEYKLDGDQTQTDQQTIIKNVNDEEYSTDGLFEVITRESNPGVGYNQEAIGRTPIVRIDLMHGDEIVTHAFVKLLITVVKSDVDFTVEAEETTKELICDLKVNRVIGVEILREAVYGRLNINHVEFWNNYTEYDEQGKLNAYVKKDCKVVDFPVPYLRDGDAGDGKLTKDVVWDFGYDDIVNLGLIGDGKFEGYLVLTNKIDAASALPTHITFHFVVYITLQDPNIDPQPKPIYWEKDKDGKPYAIYANVNWPTSVDDVAENCWFNTPIQYQPWLTPGLDPTKVADPYCHQETSFAITSLSIYKGQKDVKYTGEEMGIKLTTFKYETGAEELSIALDKTNADIKEALNTNNLYATVTWTAIAETGDTKVLKTFLVHFIRPLTLNMPENQSVKDAVTGGDVIEFDHKGLLVDWRGELVYGPTTKDVTLTDYFWKKTCNGHSVVLPGHYEVLSQAYFKLYADKVEVPATEAYYSYSYQLLEDAAVWEWFKNAPSFDGNQIQTEVDWRGRVYYEDLSGKKHYRPELNMVAKEVITGNGKTLNEAKANARKQVEALDIMEEYGPMGKHYFHYLDAASNYSCGRSSTDLGGKLEKAGTAGYVYYVYTLDYRPAELRWIEPSIYTPEEGAMCNPKPGMNDPAITEVGGIEKLTEGFTVGCWTWTRFEKPDTVTEAGQYWDFYGPMPQDGLVSLDLEGVKTSLKDGKHVDGHQTGVLPSGVTLRQIGNALRYENVQSPITEAYYLYIPASWTYGWGTLKATYVVKVNPTI